MKNVLALLVASFFIAPVAWAWPNVGDRADYQAHVMVNGATYNGQYLVTTAALDAASDSLDLEIFTNFQGTTSTETVKVKLSELREIAAKIPELVSRCAEIGGAPEVLATPAGRFSTCKVANDSDKATGFIWYADVVYGWVKQVTTDRNNAQVTEAVLNSFRLGL